jgi:hypothetical protein
MNLNLASLFGLKQPHTVTRWHAATGAENRAARQLRADRRMELEIMAIHMTEEQRKAAMARALRRAS